MPENQSENDLSQQENNKEDAAVNATTECQELTEKLAASERLAQENRNHWLTAQAELENLRRRTERELANAHKYAVEKFAAELLPVVDNLERSLVNKNTDPALKDFYVGVELTLKSLLEVLAKFGILAINPHDEQFDAARHTAISTRAVEGVAANQILEVVQKGYWIKDRLLRPALVVVAQ